MVANIDMKLCVVFSKNSAEAFDSGMNYCWKNRHCTYTNQILIISEMHPGIVVYSSVLFVFLMKYHLDSLLSISYTSLHHIVTDQISAD